MDSVIRVSKSVLEEAQELVDGERASAYGDIHESASRFAQIASAATGLDIKAEHFPIIMVAVKLSRIQNNEGWHRDSWVDICGYGRVAEKLHHHSGPMPMRGDTGE